MTWTFGPLPEDGFYHCETGFAQLLMNDLLCEGARLVK
jgi:hypothetical protein